MSHWKPPRWWPVPIVITAVLAFALDLGLQWYGYTTLAEQGSEFPYWPILLLDRAAGILDILNNLFFLILFLTPLLWTGLKLMERPVSWLPGWSAALCLLTAILLLVAGLQFPTPGAVRHLDSTELEGRSYHLAAWFAPPENGYGVLCACDRPTSSCDGHRFYRPDLFFAEQADLLGDAATNTLYVQLGTTTIYEYPIP